MPGQTEYHDLIAEKLRKLSTKDAVKAALVLDRATGAVLTTTGDVLFVAQDINDAGSSSIDTNNEVQEQGQRAMTESQVDPRRPNEIRQEQDGSDVVDVFASRIWHFLGVADAVVAQSDHDVGFRTSYPLCSLLGPTKC
jgi:hypothetical protein